MKINKYYIDQLQETGISFEIVDEGDVGLRFRQVLRDRNLPLGDGYRIEISAGETRGEIRLEFDSFSKFLLDKSKLLLAKNIENINKTRLSGQFKVLSDHKAFDIAKDTIELEKATDICMIYESSMFDLRKEEEFSKLLSELSIAIKTIVLNVLPYENEVFGEVEGRQVEISSTKYERSRKNRLLCLMHYGYSCQICGFDFYKIYGEIAENFIHVHHIEQISSSGIVKIDPIKDLIPLCPNCHSVIHLSTPPLKPVELQKILRKRNEPV